MRRRFRFARERRNGEAYRRANFVNHSAPRFERCREPSISRASTSAPDTRRGLFPRAICKAASTSSSRNWSRPAARRARSSLAGRSRRLRSPASVASLSSASCSRVACTSARETISFASRRALSISFCSAPSAPFTSSRWRSASAICRLLRACASSSSRKKKAVPYVDQHREEQHRRSGLTPNRDFVVEIARVHCALSGITRSSMRSARLRTASGSAPSQHRAPHAPCAATTRPRSARVAHFRSRARRPRSRHSPGRRRRRCSASRRAWRANVFGLSAQTSRPRLDTIVVRYEAVDVLAPCESPPYRPQKTRFNTAKKIAKLMS